MDCSSRCNPLRFADPSGLLFISPVTGIPDDTNPNPRPSSDEGVCCREKKKCEVSCSGFPGYPVIFCTPYEVACGKTRYLNAGLFQWLDRRFNFIGVLSCEEFDRRLQQQNGPLANF